MKANNTCEAMRVFQQRSYRLRLFSSPQVSIREVGECEASNRGSNEQDRKQRQDIERASFVLRSVPVVRVQVLPFSSVVRSPVGCFPTICTRPRRSSSHQHRFYGFGAFPSTRPTVRLTKPYLILPSASSGLASYSHTNLSRSALAVLHHSSWHLRPRSLGLQRPSSTVSFRIRLATPKGLLCAVLLPTCSWERQFSPVMHPNPRAPRLSDRHGARTSGHASKQCRTCAVRAALV